MRILLTKIWERAKRKSGLQWAGLIHRFAAEEIEPAQARKRRVLYESLITRKGWGRRNPPHTTFADFVYTMLGVVWKGENEMGGDQFDYTAIIADLEAKKNLLETAIASLRAALAGGSMGSSDAASFAIPAGSQGSEVPDGAFLGKSIPAAMKLYLNIVAKKQTTREIAEGIKKGGLESTSKFFEKIVYATLDRLRKSGEIVKIGDSWGLPGWYPAHIRAGLSQPGKPKPRPTSKKRPSVKARIKAAKKVRAQAESGQPKLLTDGGPQAAVERFFAGHPGKEFSSKELADTLSMKVQTVGLIASKLAHSGLLEKTVAGQFRLANKS